MGNSSLRNFAVCKGGIKVDILLPKTNVNSFCESKLRNIQYVITCFLIAFHFSVSYAQQTDISWQNITDETGTNYVHLIGSEPLQNIETRPINRGMDEGKLFNIYVTDAFGSPLSEKKAKELLILTQSAMRSNYWALNPEMATYGNDFELDSNVDNLGLTYFVWAPRHTQQWWRDGFLYEDTATAGLEGLNNWHYRAAMYEKVVLDAVLQPDINDRMLDEIELGQQLNAILDIAGLPSQTIEILKSGVAHSHFNINQQTIETTVNNWQEAGIDGEIVEFMDKFGLALGVVGTGVEIAGDAARQLYLQTLADARARKRLDAIGWLVNNYPGSLDSALVEGYNRAVVTFQDMTDIYYDDIGEALLNAVVNNVANLADLAIGIADMFSNHPAIGIVAKPYILAWKLYNGLRQDIQDAQRLVLGASLQRSFYETGALSDFWSKFANRQSLAGEIQTAMELLNMNFYLGWYAYRQYYNLYADNLFAGPFDWMTGGQITEIINGMDRMRQINLDYWHETAEPLYISRNEGEGEWIVGFLGDTPMNVTVTTDKDEYNANNNVVITVQVKNSDDVLLSGVNISCTIKRSGTAIFGPIFGTTSNGLWEHNQTASTFGGYGNLETHVTAELDGYTTKTSSVAFKVNHPILIGHDTGVTGVAWAGNSDVNPENGDVHMNIGESIRISGTYVKNFGDYSETNIPIYISLSGPANEVSNIRYINLNPGEENISTESLTLNTAGVPNGLYELKVHTDLAGDANPDNNGVSWTIVVGNPCCDGGDLPYASYNWYRLQYMGSSPDSYLDSITGYSIKATYLAEDEVTLWSESQTLGICRGSDPPKSYPNDEVIAWLDAATYASKQDTYFIDLYIGVRTTYTQEDLMQDVYVYPGSYYYYEIDSKYVAYFDFHLPSFGADTTKTWLHCWNPRIDCLIADYRYQWTTTDYPNSFGSNCDGNYHSSIWVDNSGRGSGTLPNYYVFVPSIEMPNGDYNFIIIQETDAPHGEGWNRIGFVHSVQITVFRYRDLRVDSIEANPIAPRSSDQVQITVNVENQGDVGESNVAVSLGILGPGGYNISLNNTISNISALGGQANCVFDWDTSGLEAGNYTLSADIDLSDDANPNNNHLETSLPLGPPPPLQVEVSTDKGIYDQLENMYINIMVKDEGEQPIEASVHWDMISLETSTIIESGSGTSMGGTLNIALPAPQALGSYRFHALASKISYADREDSIDFEVRDSTAPSIPQLLAPADERIIYETKPTLRWTVSSDTDSGVGGYIIEIDNIEIQVVDPCYLPDLDFEYGVHTWQVRAFDNAIPVNYSNWSSEWTFTILPPNITVISPNGGETWHVGDTEAITWDSQAIAGDVKIEIGRNLDWSELTNILASDGQAGDYFGRSVAVSGNVMVIGADHNDDKGNESGSAYVFRFNGLNWIEETKLLPAEGAPEQAFGSSVTVSGNIALIGARRDDENGDNSGSAYIFRFDGSKWIEETKLLPSDGTSGDEFGSSVAISGDLAIVGAEWKDLVGPDMGAAYVFRFDGANWNQEKQLLPTDLASTHHDHFGYSVAISGESALIGAPYHEGTGNNSGLVYAYRFDGSDWIEEARLLPADIAAGDFFGISVAISRNVAVMGASSNGAMGVTGSAYVYRFNGSNWLEETKLLPSDGAADDMFGWSVSASSETLVIGARDDDDNGSKSGSAYVFNFNGANWIEEAKLIPTDGAAGDWFGNTLAIEGNEVVIGAYNNDDNGDNSGSAYIFKINNSSWSEIESSTENDGTYLWAIEEPTSSRCRIRITSLSNPSVFDTSDRNFNIIKEPYVSNLTPTSGPPGTYMIIEGQDFGILTGSVIFAGGKIGEILQWNNTIICCRVQLHATTGDIIVKSNYGLDSSGSFFEIMNPTPIYVKLDHTPNIENGTIIYPFSKIQRAIDSASNNLEIIVTQGTYYENIDFLNKITTVRSIQPKDPNIVKTTIINANKSGPVVSFRNDKANGSVLSGFTITGGRGYFFPNYTLGGGIFIENCNPTIKHCIIEGNSAKYGGGLMCINSSVQINNCWFFDNHATLYGGGMRCNYSDPNLINCLFSNNSANERGGGFYNFHSNSILTNCTFTGNVITQSIYPDHGGGGLYIFDYDPIVSNCILWENIPEEIYIRSGTPNVTYSDVQDGWPGIGNIDIDPNFVDAANGDYHLKSQAGRWNPELESWIFDPCTSPCIDAGDLTSDWSGELWPHGKRINMGTYGGTTQASMSSSMVGNRADLNCDGKVDLYDWSMFSNKWMWGKILLAEDLNRNGVIDLYDVVLFMSEWLWREY